MGGSGKLTGRRLHLSPSSGLPAPLLALFRPWDSCEPWVWRTDV